MRPGGGKAKGSGMELQIANKLSAALAPLKFIRSQSSGARVGGKNYETLGKMFGEDALKLFCGDVVAVNEKEAGVEFRHSIECKAYKTPDNFTGLVSGTANIYTWMKESEDDAIKIKRNPLLILKWNHTPVFVLSYPTEYSPTPKLILEKDNISINIFYFTDLLLLPNFWYDVKMTN